VLELLISMTMHNALAQAGQVVGLRKTCGRKPALPAAKGYPVVPSFTLLNEVTVIGDDLGPQH